MSNHNKEVLIVSLFGAFVGGSLAWAADGWSLGWRVGLLVFLLLGGSFWALGDSNGPLN